MFGSTILDVIVGLVCVFLAISLVASSTTEAVSSLMNLRAKTLLAGVKQLLNDPGLNGLAAAVYNHGLVNPLSDGKTIAGKTPSLTSSYIDAAHFATALINSVHRAAGAGSTLEDAIGKVPDPQVKATLEALYSNAAGKVDAFHQQVAHWFDTSMDRLSGTYKRWTKVITFIVGLLAAATLNADPVHVSELLWERPAAAAQIANIIPPPASDNPRDIMQFLNQIDTAGTLLGWNGFAADDPRRSPIGFAAMVLGWLITAFATLFGASFWFDTLQRFVQLRGTGRPIGTIGANS